MKNPFLKFKMDFYVLMDFCEIVFVFFTFRYARIEQSKYCKQNTSFSLHREIFQWNFDSDVECLCVYRDTFVCELEWMVEVHLYLMHVTSRCLCCTQTASSSSLSIAHDFPFFNNLKNNNIFSGWKKSIKIKISHTKNSFSIHIQWSKKKRLFIFYGVRNTVNSFGIFFKIKKTNQKILTLFYKKFSRVHSLKSIHVCVCVCMYACVRV